ncbi:hypothetical protein BC628DRAFT_739833 [Trametes gibbosa]|nr:hypothetical protein BC628DRAFT_739833 [Trametes gibbosa]
MCDIVGVCNARRSVLGARCSGGCMHAVDPWRPSSFESWSLRAFHRRTLRGSYNEHMATGRPASTLQRAAALLLRDYYEQYGGSGTSGHSRRCDTLDVQRLPGSIATALRNRNRTKGLRRAARRCTLAFGDPPAEVNVACRPSPSAAADSSATSRAPRSPSRAKPLAYYLKLGRLGRPRSRRRPRVCFGVKRTS